MALVLARRQSIRLGQSCARPAPCDRTFPRCGKPRGVIPGNLLIFMDGDAVHGGDETEKALYVLLPPADAHRVSGSGNSESNLSLPRACTPPVMEECQGEDGQQAGTFPYP